MADQVRRAAIHSFQDFGDVDGQIVHTYAVERAAALSGTAHVNRDGLQPSGSEYTRQVVKITGAAAGIREQHDGNSGPVRVHSSVAPPTLMFRCCCNLTL